MKETYTISEISRLYGIGADSLRYYERIGVLKPRRGANGYRLYSLRDIYRLTILRDLRNLGFPIKRIKDYLDNHTLDSTLALLREEQAFVDRQMKALHVRKQILRERVAALSRARHVATDVVRVCDFPDRPCLQLDEHITRDEEMDFAVKKLHRRHEHRIRDFGNLAIGAAVSLEDLRRGTYNVFHRVFFLLEQPDDPYDFLLPAGRYLSCFYRGDYSQSPRYMQKVLAWARQRHWVVTGDPFELYEIDNRDTMCPEEFLTQIQVPVAPQQQLP